MLRSLRFTPATSSASSSVVSRAALASSLLAPFNLTSHRHSGGYGLQTNNMRDAGVHERAPKDGVDFEFTGDPQAVIPGTHPLPLTGDDVKSLRWPLVSPFVPSPKRVHPYFTEPPQELPFFQSSVPIIYTWNTIKERIIAPVFDISTGSVSHTRELDPFVFGQWPDQDLLDKNSTYWQVRNQNYEKTNELGRWEIFRKSKKNWANTGTGMGRVRDRKNHRYPWGGRRKPNKSWNMKLPTAQPGMWQFSNRMMLSLKMLQGKLMVVDRLTLDQPSNKSFLELCEKMQWDVRHEGAGVLFVDGGSRLMPSLEFDLAFFYGSFYNGRCKLVRPTITADRPYNWNYPVRFQSYRGPKGPKNPIPLNRFNVYDALDHHLLVVTEGAIQQMEQEVEDVKLSQLPPHIVAQLHERGLINGSSVGHIAPQEAAVASTPARLQTIEGEVAGRVEENERKMYDGYYDDPYSPWSDEFNQNGASGDSGDSSSSSVSYEIDAVDGFIKRHTGNSKKNGVPGSWRQLS